MAEAVLMPKVGISVEICLLTEWQKCPGDSVAVGDILFSYETDKSSLECESPLEGVLLEQFASAGDEVPVLTPVCVIGSAGEDVSAHRPGGTSGTGVTSEKSAESGGPTETGAVQESGAVSSGVGASSQTDIGQSSGKISPRARSLAAKQGVDPSLAKPTGPYGRVIERDIRAIAASGTGVGGRILSSDTTIVQDEKTASSGKAGATDETGHVSSSPAAGAVTPAGVSPAAEYSDVKFTGIRKVIAKGMTLSVTSIPQLTHHFSFDATEIMAFRAGLKQNAEKMALPNITLNDMILYVVSRILPGYPELNAHMVSPDTIRYFRDVNLGIAVDTQKGLLVPVLHNADKKNLGEIAAESKRLASQAQDGSIGPDDMSGGTFTVSNLGTFGVESFTPVINPPQTGILGVGTIIQRVREADCGIAAYPAMGISLTYDHRAIDGAPASRFAAEVCRALANFPLFLAK